MTDGYLAHKHCDCMNPMYVRACMCVCAGECCQCVCVWVCVCVVGVGGSVCVCVCWGMLSVCVVCVRVCVR